MSESAVEPLDESVRLLQILEDILSGPLYTNGQAATSWEAGTLATARHCFQAGGLRIVGPAFDVQVNHRTTPLRVVE